MCGKFTMSKYVLAALAVAASLSAAVPAQTKQPKCSRYTPCTPVDTTAMASDGYAMEREEYRRQEMTVRVVYYRKYSALREAAQANRATETQSVRAFSVIQGGVCTIHMLDPLISYRPELLGHELAHCFHGSWHP